MKVEEFEFPSTVKPPGSTSTLFLAGAGVRGLQIKDQFIKFTTIGVYLADESIPSLSTKWKSKSPQELSNSLDFFMDIVKGEFEKFERITMILPLTGQQYSEKVMENAVAYMKTNGTYTESEAEAVEKFKEIFKNETFNPGSSILFTHSPLGHLTIGFSKDESIPEEGNAIIKNSVLSESILESIIGKNGVSPEAKNSVAIKVSELLSEEKDSEKIEGEKLLNKEEEDVEEKSEGKEASHSL